MSEKGRPLGHRPGPVIRLNPAWPHQIPRPELPPISTRVLPLKTLIPQAEVWVQISGGRARRWPRVTSFQIYERYLAICLCKASHLGPLPLECWEHPEGTMHSVKSGIWGGGCGVRGHGYGAGSQLRPQVPARVALLAGITSVPSKHKRSSSIAGSQDGSQGEWSPSETTWKEHEVVAASPWLDCVERGRKDKTKSCELGSARFASKRTDKGWEKRTEALDGVEGTVTLQKNSVKAFSESLMTDHKAFFVIALYLYFR